MSEWHAQVKPTHDWRKDKKSIEATTSSITCSCKAQMKGKWIKGEYKCLRCDKPVYA